MTFLEQIQRVFVIIITAQKMRSVTKTHNMISVSVKSTTRTGDPDCIVPKRNAFHFRSDRIIRIIGD
ncbi:MAG: hypothetical protein AUG75_18920 [Cyanobacteria bacterium 13_1_20CM_4_61_6]|nr:MAG: hypothetical protein AUG75_18920 [Cyanobacteria bacterium 13_1_20CM_4_61_6]